MIEINVSPIKKKCAILRYGRNSTTQFNNCQKVRFRHFDTQDVLRSKHSTFLLYIMRKSFWNESGWPVFISRRLTDMHGIRFMHGFKEGGGGQESPPSLENSNLINSHCLISETDLGPDWKTKSSLAAPPPPCNKCLDPRTKLATGHMHQHILNFHWFVRPSVRIIRWTQCS